MPSNLSTEDSGVWTQDLKPTATRKGSGKIQFKDKQDLPTVQPIADVVKSSKNSKRSDPTAIGRFLATALAALGVIMMGAMPTAMAIDFGGVFMWTQFWFAVTTLGISIIAVIQIVVFHGNRHTRDTWAIVPATGIVLFAIFQAIPLPEFIGFWLAPASYAAYHDWIAPFLTATNLPLTSASPISVNAENTLHHVALAATAVALFWSASRIIVTRRRITWFLTIVSLGGVAIASIGIFRQMVPTFSLLGYVGNQQTFANFVNRNNAALFLNYTAAASLGLLAWRLATVSGSEVDDDQFELSDLISLAGESESSVALIGLLSSMAGLLVCGSRGGLVATVAGGLLGFGWIHRRRGMRQIFVVASAIVAALVTLLIPLRLDLTSLRRFDGVFTADFSSLTLDGRWTHWSDTVAAIWGYFPLGSGLGTYGEAHLPFLKNGGSAWFFHADNLWLEWMLELGLPGIIAGIAMTVFAIRALLQLAESSDPLDHGIRVAGWYMLASTLVSQCFDFGLLMPSNFTILVITFAIVYFRAGEMRVVVAAKRDKELTTSADTTDGKGVKRLHDGTKGANKIGFGGSGSLAKAFLPAAIAVLVAFLATASLRRDAIIESAVLHAEQLQTEGVRGEASLDNIASLLGKFSGGSPRLSQSLVGVNFARGRTADALSMEPKSIADAMVVYQETDPIARRLDWVNGSVLSDVPSSPEAETNYQTSLNELGKLFQAAPLSMPARRALIYLDFFHQNPKASLSAIEQLRGFHKGQHSDIYQWSQYAAASNQKDLASSMLREALDQAPHLVYRIAALVEEDPQLDIDEILSDEPEVMSNAWRWLIRQIQRPQDLRAGVDEPLIQRAIDSVINLETNDVAQQVQKFRILGDLAYSIKQYDQAFGYYDRAMDLDSGNWTIRRMVIEQLRLANRFSEALQLARRAKQLNPDEPAIEAVISQLEHQTKADRAAKAENGAS